MRFTLGRLRPKLATVSCIVYGVAVALVTFAPALAALWRVTRPSAGKGTVSVSADNTLMMHISMHSTTLPEWTGTVNVGALILWIIGPPLLLWIAWLARGPKHTGNVFHYDNSGTDTPALRQPGPDDFPARHTPESERTRSRE